MNADKQHTIRGTCGAVIGFSGPPPANARYDVVIFEIATRKIESIAGRDMRLDTGHSNAESRLQTVFPRLNENYSAEIVAAGKFIKGDVLPG